MSHPSDGIAATVDGEKVAVVWVDDHGSGKRALAAFDDQIVFGHGWVFFETLDGGKRALPAHRVDCVLHEVSEDYLGEVR